MASGTSRHAAFRNLLAEYAHIEDPAEQRRLILSAIDNAPLGWSQIRAAIVAGVGFLTDSYDIFALSLITDILGYVYFTEHGRRIPKKDDNIMKASTSVGIIAGQLFFGWLADVVGRKRMYGIELIIVILATLGQTLSSASTSVSITGIMVFWRIVMGCGLGGDYPLSSVITAEFATTKYRGGMMAAVFAMQGIGQLLASVVALIATEGFKSILSSPNNICGDGQCSANHSGEAAADRIWRIIIGFGAVPATLALYYRLTIPETPRYTFDIGRDVEQAYADTVAWAEDHIGPMKGSGAISEEREERRVGLCARGDGGLDKVPRASWGDFRAYFGQWRNGKVLLGTAGSWFCLDVAFYGIALNNPVILRKIGYAFLESDHTDHSVYSVFRNQALGNLVLVCAGSIPGYWVTVFTIDRLGRKTIQIMGFAVLTLLFVVLGFAFNRIGDNAKLALYILCNFFFNFGPNATTFIVPGECFPTRYRSTSHGISSAAGKVGSVVATFLIGELRVRGTPRDANDDSPWLNHVMQIFALFMLIGLGLSFLIPETMGKSLEELAGGEEVMEGMATLEDLEMEGVGR